MGAVAELSCRALVQIGPATMIPRASGSRAPARVPLIDCDELAALLDRTDWEARERLAVLLSGQAEGTTMMPPTPQAGREGDGLDGQRRAP